MGFNSGFKGLNENNIRISVFTASKKELLGTKVTENYMVIYNGSLQIHQRPVKSNDMDP